MLTWSHNLACSLAWCVVASAVFAAPPLAADPCKNPQTQAEMNTCANMRFAAADAALNAAYQSLMTVVPDEAKDSLRAAQRAWLDYRDKHCECAAGLATGGTMFPLLRSECREKVTMARTAEIRAMEADTRAH